MLQLIERRSDCPGHFSPVKLGVRHICLAISHKHKRVSNSMTLQFSVFSGWLINFDHRPLIRCRWLGGKQMLQRDLAVRERFLSHRFYHTQAKTTLE